MIRTSILLAAVAFLAMTGPAAAAKRPMKLDDLFAFKRVSDPQVSPDGSLVVYVVTTVDLPGNKTISNLWLAATDGKTPPRQLTTTEKKDRHPRWSPDGSKILFESTRSGKSQLWLIELAGGEARKLTDVSTEASNAIWSRDGSHIAFVSAVYPEFSEKPFAESDKLNKEKLEAVEKNPVKARVFKRLFYRHWDSWVEDKRQHLFVMSQSPDRQGGWSDPHDATPGDRDAYPTSTTFSVGDDFCFSPDGKHLVFAAVPAEGEAWSTNYDICRVAIDNKSTNWESLTKDNPAADNSPQFSPDGTKLAYRAQKKTGYEADKWDILVADCSPDGKMTKRPKNLTQAKDVSVSDIVWGGDDAVTFVAEDGGATSLFHATLAGEVGEGAWHNGIKGGTAKRSGQITALNCSHDGKVWTHLLARMDHPPEVTGFRMESVESTGRVIGLAHLSPQNRALLDELDRPRPESVTVPGAGGHPMQMWVLKPPGFDPSKKWPVAYLVHGGPQGAWDDGWSFRWCPELWAAQGYIVALPNPRGSTGFGQKYTDEITGDWGGKCYQDLVAGLEYLKKQPYVDASRMGAAGASFGGYMMNWFAVNDIAKEFKCLITHCSVYNFESMYATTDEVWFDEWEHGGPPWGKHRESYEKQSPHRLAGKLGEFKTPMLVIHNDLDFRCPIGQGQELFTALQRQGVPSKFVNFPDEGHWVLKPANSKFWHEEVFAWLTKYVPPGGK
jgi:dipeptidyl aminopeptidase/acylaminoacyl peptidase